ncbi:MAG: M48 family metallopeptidase [Planctomycetota bacterium]
MKANCLKTLGAGILFGIQPACNLALIPEGTMNALGAEAYVEATSPYREIVGTPEADMVRRIGERIAAASGRNYEWEFKLLDAPDTVNAFCLPGGKIAVYTGILPITQNEDGLAVVMGHEVAHATAQHGNKRMTQGMGLEFGMNVASAFLSSSSNLSPEAHDGIMTAIGAGAQFGLVLPYGRDHESEADEIGLRFLVRAGYDPYEAPRLWERMAQAFPERQPEWMSTHPDPMRRAKELEAMIPRVLADERGR